MSSSGSPQIGTLLGGFQLTGRVGSFGGWVLFEAENALDSKIERLLWLGDDSEAFAAHGKNLSALHPAVARCWGLRKDGGLVFLELELFEQERLDRLRASWAGAAVAKTGATPFVPAQVMVECLLGGPSRVEKTRVIVHDFAKKATEAAAPKEPETLALKHGVERAQVIDLQRLKATAEIEAKSAQSASRKKLLVGVGVVVVLLLLLGLLLHFAS